MTITWLGELCFKLRGKETTVLIDPYQKDESGKLLPKTKADIITFSHQKKLNIDRVVDSAFVISGPGEYEIKGVNILGLALDGATVYVYEIDGLKVCFLRKASQLTEKQQEGLGEIHVLLVPANEKTVRAIEQLEPKIVVPIKASREFFKEMGQEELKPVNKLTVTPSSLPEEREVVWLKR